MEDKKILNSHEHASHEHHGHEHEHLVHEHHVHEVKGNTIKCRLTQCWETCKGVSLKTVIWIAVAIVLLTLLFVYKGLFVAATVNGSPISRFSVVKELEARSGKAALDNLIVEKLISMEAAKKGVKITDEQIAAEITNIENQIKSQGGTLDQALSMQGMSMTDLKSQIRLQKELESLLGDKLAVTDAEIESYIKDNKVQIPAGQEASYRENITQQLKQQKLNSEAGSYIESLKAQSSIKYFVNY